MAERLEDELRALGRDWDREPDDATVAAITEAATSAPERKRRFGDIGVLAAAAALLTGVTVAGVVVPWVVARDAVPATRTSTSPPPSPTRTGNPWQSAHCGEWGTPPYLVGANDVTESTGWRPPGTGTPWGKPVELRITALGKGYGTVIATYRVGGRLVTLERYPSRTTFPPPERGESSEVPLAGASALLVEMPSRTPYTVEFVGAGSSSHGRHDCFAPRLMWVRDGVGWAVTGHLSTEELVALAETL
ncbi:hypothetical protein SUDANB95_01646 [Actinosynnema sp. ALI-1.44]